MDEKRPGLAGDPSDPIAYLKEFLRGEISYNPKALSEAYMRLAEQSDGTTQLAYSALAWAVGSDPIRMSALQQKIKSLEDRVASLERQAE